MLSSNKIYYDKLHALNRNIEDDGSGIRDQDHGKLFTMGYSTATDGTGFGLSIVKQVIDAHGWSVRVTDGTGGGARFEITEVEFVG